MDEFKYAIIEKAVFFFRQRHPSQHRLAEEGPNPIRWTCPLDWPQTPRRGAHATLYDSPCP